MSITRSTGGLNLPAPPPSPIPTGRGTRSAANEILIDYLEKSLNVPDLTLPGPCIPLNKHQNIPAEISYRLLKSRDHESQDRLLKSVKESGAFKVLDHGISDEELGFLVKEADLVFRVLEPTNVGFPEKSSTGDSVGFCLAMIEGHWRESSPELKDFVISAKRWRESKPPFLDDENRKSSDHTLCLHFPTTQSQFSVQSDRGPLSFEAGPDTIVVTVGKHFGEWSQGSFESVSGEIICDPHLQDDQASFLIELKCLSSNLEIVTHRDYETISLRDQILIGLIIAFLYNVYVFLCS
ncbi:hypothetical protein OIU76_030538 [Salix suchowensis]|nr:hypothetical protein OIU76_030538 [Salix suchowensis]